MQFQLLQESIDSELFVAFFALTVSAANLFIYCYFGANATEDLLYSVDYLFKADWYKLPVNLQKYFILMIANTQKPIVFDGMGMMKVDLR